jgi:hypothetical protein
VRDRGELLKLISNDPNVCLGRPLIRGTRCARRSLTPRIVDARVKVPLAFALLSE